MVAESANWFDRLTDALRSHEKERASVQPALPRYENLQEIQRGGMGVVYRAWDARMGRDVALKVLQDHAGASPDARERMLREAQFAARLEHRHIVPVYDTGVLNGQIYIAMRLIEGTTLDRAHLALRPALNAIRDAAEALDFAHAQGVVHRDIKPGNLLVDREDRVYVTDFGVARQTSVPSDVTITGTIVGTPVYMSPEQAYGKEVDPRSDIYSLGATMYEILCGRPPFSGSDPVAIVEKVRMEDPPAPRKVNPTLPRDVEAIILVAMDKDPARRYVSAGAMAEDIRRALEGHRIVATPPGWMAKARRWVRRNRRVTVSLAVACAAAVAAVLIPLHMRWTEQERRLLEMTPAVANLIWADDLKEAKARLEEMREIDPSHPETLRAEALVAEAVGVYERFEKLQRDVQDALSQEKSLEQDYLVKLDGAWTFIREMRDLRIERLVPFGKHPPCFQGAAARASEWSQILESRLEFRTRQMIQRSQPAGAWGVIELWAQVDTLSLNRFLPGESFRVSRWAEARREGASAQGLADGLVALIREDPASSFTSDLVGLAGAAFSREKDPLAAADLLQKIWPLGVEAFVRKDVSRLEAVVQVAGFLPAPLFRAASPRKPADLLAARDWLREWTRAGRLLPGETGPVRTIREELGQLKVAVDFQSAAQDRLKDLDRDIARCDLDVRADRFASEARDARRDLDVDAARKAVESWERLRKTATDKQELDALAARKGLTALMAGCEDLVNRERETLARLDGMGERLRAEELTESQREEEFGMFLEIRKQGLLSGTLKARRDLRELDFRFLAGLAKLKELAPGGDAQAFEKAFTPLAVLAGEDPAWRARLSDGIVIFCRKLLDVMACGVVERWATESAALNAGDWRALDLRGRARREMGKAADAAGDWRAAKRILDRVLESAPGRADLRLERAGLNHRLGDSAAALADAKAAAEARPDDKTLLAWARARYVAAMVSTDARDAGIDEAVEILGRAARAGADDARVSFWIGVCRVQQGRVEPALESLSRARDRFKVLAPCLMGLMELRRKNWEKAAACAQESTGAGNAMSEDEYVAMMAEGEGLSMAGALLRARRDAQCVLASACLNRGASLEDCVKSASEVIRIDKGWGPDVTVGRIIDQAYYLRGLARSRRHDRAGSLEDLQMAESLATNPALKEKARMARMMVGESR